MATRATERKKREREESRPVLEAFGAFVDVTNPTALSAFLSPFGTPCELDVVGSAVGPQHSKSGGGGGAARAAPYNNNNSCTSDHAVQRKMNAAAVSPSSASTAVIGEGDAAAIEAISSTTTNTYLKINFESVVKLCEAVKINPLELKRALLAFCPRAVTFEKHLLSTATNTAATAEEKAASNDAPVVVVESVNAADVLGDEDEEGDNAAPLETANATAVAAVVSGDAGDDSTLSPAERRAKRYDAMPWSTNVGDLIFVLLGVAAPTDVRERRRLDGDAQTLAALTFGSSDATDIPPLIRHFRRLFEGHFKSEGNTEADAFFKALTEPLPMALRMHRTEMSLYHIAHHFLRRRAEGVNGLGSVVKPVEWLLPSSSSSSSPCVEYDGKYICESFSCAHEDYHKHPNVMSVCKTLHSSGAFSFQELVSVIPVLGLGIKGHHRVLDMCAAPGSKTLLAVDMAFAESGSKPLGVIWANEKDHTKAMQTLPARMKRHHAPNVITTKCDATQLPMMFRADPTAADGSGVATVRFDRIICDVPCSGDGTVRKERSLIGTWNERYIESLVPTQIRLLRRGLELLEEGGVLAYSTCSLNPKEDEEVLFEVLKNYSPDSMQLLGVREALRSTYDGALALDTFPTGNGIRVTPTAPCSESPNFRGHRAQDLPLLADTIAATVLRVLPHVHNTGGFFVALIKKITHTSPANQLPPNVAAKLNHWTGHKRYVVLDVSKKESEASGMWKGICDFYGIPYRPSTTTTEASDSDSAAAAEPIMGVPMAKKVSEVPADLPYFYQLIPTAFLNPDGKGQLKRIQLLSPLAADWVTRVRPYKGPSVDLVLAGTRAFEMYDGTYLANAACRWRVVSEAATVVAKVASKRKMLIDLDANADSDSAVRLFLKELFVKGFVNLNEMATEGTAPSSSSALPDLHPSVAALLEPFLSESKDNWLVGGLLIGIVGGLGAFEQSSSSSSSSSSGVSHEDQVWWLSGSLSGRKLELTVDISNRALGLTTYFGMVDPFLGGKTLAPTAAGKDDAQKKSGDDMSEEQ